LNGHLLDNVTLTVNTVQKDTKNNPLFSEEYFGVHKKKWEVRYDNGYPNVIYDPKYQKYRCYYTSFTYDNDSSNTSLKERINKRYVPSKNRISSLCYAESIDGINWYKPNLNLVNFDGSYENNILMEFVHGTSVFLDEEELDFRKRYKLITKVDYPSGRSYMAVSFSEDGIHFGKLIEWPRYNPQADTHNFAFKDKKTGKYKVITRIWQDGVRIPAISESIDFINWSEPEEILRGDGFQNQIYSMPVFQCEDIYVGLASIYHEGDRSDQNYDLVDIELKYATNIGHWDSVCKGQYFIPRGEGFYPDGEFDCGCIYAASPIEIDNKLYFYYMGGNGPHTDFRETSFARSWIEKDKFAYYETKDKNREGILYTRPFTILGDDLFLLTDIDTLGEISVSLCKENEESYEGFELENSVLIGTDTNYQRICFKKKKVQELKGKSVVILIKFKNARIYSIAGDIETNKIRL